METTNDPKLHEAQPGERRTFALFESEDGKLRMSTAYANPRQLLLTLNSVIEDLREMCAVEAMTRQMMQAAASAPRVQPVGLGVPGLVPPNGKITR